MLLSFNFTPTQALIAFCILFALRYYLSLLNLFTCIISILRLHFLSSILSFVRILKAADAKASSFPLQLRMQITVLKKTKTRRFDCAHQAVTEGAQDRVLEEAASPKSLKAYRLPRRRRR